MLRKYLFILLSIAIGIVMGLATVFGQKYLPSTLNSLANSGSVWIVVAFYIAVRYKEKWKSILSSIIYLFVCVATYYGYYALAWNTGFNVGFHQFVWYTCAIIFGFIFGLGANLSQHGNKKVKYLCKMLLPASFLSEGLLLLSHFQQYSHMIDVMLMWLLLGILFYFINSKKEWSTKKCFISLGIMTLLGFLGFQIVYYSDMLIL